tara:strand:+ start:3668 stop:3862 length:195 start_codon:yes stop_codon:yes gene_type:complete
MLTLIFSIFLLGVILKPAKSYGRKKHKLIAEKRYFQSIFSEHYRFDSSYRKMKKLKKTRGAIDV